MNGKDAREVSLTRLDLGEISEEAAKAHFSWLLDWGYVDGKPVNSSGSLAPLDYRNLRITGQGVLFLETFRNESFYGKAKAKAMEIGGELAPQMLMKVADIIMGGS